MYHEYLNNFLISEQYHSYRVRSKILLTSNPWYVSLGSLLKVWMVFYRIEHMFGLLKKIRMSVTAISVNILPAKITFPMNIFIS